jgi:hypothetical protein
LRYLAALVLALTALALPACGGDSESASDTTEAQPPDLTVPSTTGEGDASGDSTSTDDDSGTTGEDPSTAEQAPGEGDGSGSDDPSTAEQAPGEGDGNSADDVPDSATNDTPPESGSAAERFEQYCAENPDSC